MTMYMFKKFQLDKDVVEKLGLIDNRLIDFEQGEINFHCNKLTSVSTPTQGNCIVTRDKQKYKELLKIFEGRYFNTNLWAFLGTKDYDYFKSVIDLDLPPYTEFLTVNIDCYGSEACRVYIEDEIVGGVTYVLPSDSNIIKDIVDYYGLPEGVE